jgi:hypothetical protein
LVGDRASTARAARKRLRSRAFSSSSTSSMRS